MKSTGLVTNACRTKALCNASLLLCRWSRVTIPFLCILRTYFKNHRWIEPPQVLADLKTLIRSLWLTVKWCILLLRAMHWYNALPNAWWQTARCSLGFASSTLTGERLSTNDQLVKLQGSLPMTLFMDVTRTCGWVNSEEWECRRAHARHRQIWVHQVQLLM